MIKANLRVVHTVAGIGSWAGGPPRTVTQLCSSLSKLNIDVHLVSGRRPARDRELVRPCEEVSLHIKDESVMRVVPGLGKLIHNLVSDARCEGKDVILHDHGLWLPINHVVARYARKHKVIRLLHPRGTLEKWSLAYRSAKKKFAMSLYQGNDLHTVDVFCATAEQEMESIRRLGFKQPVAVLPNGVGFPLAAATNSSLGTLGYRYAVFLSRIHPKKNLISLVKAWAKARPGGWKLKIAGPDEVGYLADVKREIEVQGIGSSVDILGAVEGADKASLLTGASLFILPSHSENFGVVVAEALAYGVPVISTLGTPWLELRSAGCGWWVEPTVNGLANAIVEAVNISAEEWYQRSCRAKLLAAKFNWASIGEGTNQVYQWLLGRSERPECVHMT